MTVHHKPNYSNRTLESGVSARIKDEEDIGRMKDKRLEIRVDGLRLYLNHLPVLSNHSSGIDYWVGLSFQDERAKLYLWG